MNRKMGKYIPIKSIAVKIAAGAFGLVLLGSVVFLAACGPVYSVGDLNEEQVAAISDAYFEQYYQGDRVKYDPDGIVIKNYLGTYAGHIVVVLHDQADTNVAVPAVVVSVTVDGVYIGDLGDASYEFVVYLDPAGKPEKSVLRLAEAYEQGYITKTDLLLIAAAAKS